MTKLASLLGRKPTLVAMSEPPHGPALPAAAPPAPDRTILELDQELFFPIASQLGEENELVRNLLIDAEHKITELDGIRQSLGRLVDPVSKTLRAFEEAKNDKLSLQSMLNSTRIAYSKLREELVTAEKKAASLDTECIRLREMLTVAQQSLNALELTKAEQSAELSARRAQIADLQRLVQQQATDLQLTRDDNQRVLERIAFADRRVAQLENDAEAASQKAALAEQERSTVQSQLDRALNEAAQVSRRVLDMEKAQAANQARLKKLESTLAETQSERIRLTTALEDATEAHRKDTIANNARFEALQARAQLSEKLLESSRQVLTSRANEIGAFDRRLNEATTSRGAIETKFAQIEAALIERDAQIRELEEERASLSERNTELSRAVGTRESAYNRAQERLQAQDDLVQMLEGQIKAARETAELQVQELKAQLQREQLDRTMAEGALEAGRKDIARLLRELATVQNRSGVAQEPAPARISNAA
jgi:chromosome segregation ATPase